jgi:diguanylate cyclase (GGDEF)-like protein
VDRCSVVRVWGGEDRGYVRASHEDESVSDLAIDLRKYPEIMRAMEVRGKVVFNDVLHEPLLRPFHEDLRRAKIRSLMVIPIVLFDQNIGSLFLRAARTNSGFTLREVSFCEIVAEAAANALERATLFEGIQKANERLEHLAVTDGLTGAYNHRHFRERLDDEFQRAKRYNLPLCVMILDIDNFKRVNDTFGHLQGDSVLREVAARTQQSMRKSDIVARYGGEEFVVIMPQTGPAQSNPQAERLLHEISDRPFSGMPPGNSVTVSVGVAGLVHDSMNDCEDLIRVADAALYKAKHDGKNRVVIGSL